MSDVQTAPATPPPSAPTGAKAVAPVVPPQRGRPMVPVYNPADNTEDPMVAGQFFRCPGQSVTWIEDIWDWPRDEDNRLLMSDDLSRRLLVLDAWKVAETICGPESMGPRGFVILQGEPEQQEEQIREARRTWLTVKSDEVNAVIESWEVLAYQYVQASPNPSRPGLRPNRRVQHAMRWRDEHAEELLSFGIDVPTPYTPEREAAPPAALLRAGDDEERREAIITGSTLLGRALERGLGLSVGDQKGLVAGDTEVIADVESRLAAPKPRGKKKDKPEAPDPPAE